MSEQTNNSSAAKVAINSTPRPPAGFGGRTDSLAGMDLGVAPSGLRVRQNSDDSAPQSIQIPTVVGEMVPFKEPEQDQDQEEKEPAKESIDDTVATRNKRSMEQRIEQLESEVRTLSTTGSSSAQARIGQLRSEILSLQRLLL